MLLTKYRIRQRFQWKLGFGFLMVSLLITFVVNFSKIIGVYSQNKTYDLRIIVITCNRAQSLERILRSINEAKYNNDSVKLEIWIDRSKSGEVHNPTVSLASDFRFEHGRYEVIVRPAHVGLYGQWISSWTPNIDTSEIAVILEDDLTVSPYFYKYLKLVHRKYDRYPEINGYSLQGVSILHGRGSGRLQGPKGEHVFLYPVLGTWGFSPSVTNWLQFTKWFSETKTQPSFNPYVPGNIVTGWYKGHQKQGKADNMWSIWYVYHAWKNNEYTLYCNFEGHAGLTVNWKEPGLHYTGEGGKPSNPLLTTWDEKYERLPEDPVRVTIQGYFEMP